MNARLLGQGIRALAAGLALSLATLAHAAGMGGMGTIVAAYVPGANGLNPADPSWSQTTVATVTLDTFIDYVASGGLTSGNQSMMCQGTSINLPVTVMAVNDGTNIYFRFQWADSTDDELTNNTNLFADAFAIEIPYSGSGMMIPISMGSQTNPVNIIFWRADLAAPQNIVAGGVGTVQPSPDAQNLQQYHNWSNGQWTVIIERPLTGASDNQVTLTRGSSYSIGFANWNGSDEERNGKKSISMNWKTLSIK